MKKYLLLLASAALLLVGCAKEQLSNGVDGGLTNVTFTANIESDVATKAADDGDGAAVNVNRCIMEIYFQNELYKRMETAMSGTSAPATFSNVPVVAGKEYEVLFWADHVDAVNTQEGSDNDKYYTTKKTTDNKGLKAVTINKTAFLAALEAGKNDELDAFYFADNYTVPQAGGNYDASLNRPFAQLNVITTDVGTDKTVFNSNLLPEKVYVSYKAANKINVATGVVSGEDTYSYVADVYGKWETVKTDHKELTLSMDYILAPATDQGEIDVIFKTLKGENVETDAVMTHALANLPYKRNYRTNVKGELLTVGGSWKATIDEEWSREYDYPPVEAGSIEAANASLAAGETNISITNPSDYATNTLIIPDAANGKDLIISVAENTEMELKIDATNSTPKSISLSTEKAKSLTINAPNTHVELTAGEYTNTVEATTSATTLVVGNETKIETLNIKKGNVVIEGSVTNFNNATDDQLVWNVASTAALGNAFKFASDNEEIIILKAGTYIISDISNNITVTGAADGDVVFDCNGSDCIASIPNGATFKNVTMNFGQTNYHGFQHAGHIIMEKCVLNGLFFSYGEMTFNGCIFNQEKAEYHMWDYGTNLTYKDCTFNGHGKYINAYNEGTADPAWTLNVSGCKFVNLDDNANKAPLNIKETCGANLLAFDVTVGEGNTLVGNFPAASITTSLVVNGLWQVDDRYTANPSASKIIVREKSRIVYEKGALLALSTPEQLLAFAAAVNEGNSFAGLTVFLANDIDLAGGIMTPIGTGERKFSGTFDGNNKTIKNFVINNPEADDQGLFGPVFGATIKDLTIKDGQVTGKERVGALVGTGYMYVDNVTVDGCTVNGVEQAGGIAGFISSGSIKNCNINATITGATRAGGVVGKCQADNHFAIDGNTVKGTITSTAAEGNYTAGGIACQIMWGQGSSIKNNVIDAEIICAGQKSNCPIGDYRAGGSYADMANGIDGNKWTKSKFTENQDSYTFTIGKPDGVDSVTTVNAVN